MATVFGLEQGLVEAGRHPNPPQYQGKLRIIKGSFTTSATPGVLGSGVITVNNGDVVVLGLMHKDEQVLNGLVTFGAMAGAATASIGTYTRSGNVFTAVSSTRYLNALSVTAAGQNSIAATDAQNFLDVQTLDQVYIALTAGGANYANGQTFKMAFYYVGD
jgi:hypothetical protein